MESDIQEMSKSQSSHSILMGKHLIRSNELEREKRKVKGKKQS